MNLDDLPATHPERLKAYQRARMLEEERMLVGSLLLLRDAGVELTEVEERIVAYSPYGTGISQRSC